MVTEMLMEMVTEMLMEMVMKRMVVNRRPHLALNLNMVNLWVNIANDGDEDSDEDGDGDSGQPPAPPGA